MDMGEMATPLPSGTTGSTTIGCPGKSASFGNAIASRSLNPAMAAYRGTAPENERWWTTPKHNRNQVTTGGVWIGAIAATDDFEVCSFRLLALPFARFAF